MSPLADGTRRRGEEQGMEGRHACMSCRFLSLVVVTIRKRKQEKQPPRSGRVEGVESQAKPHKPSLLRLLTACGRRTSAPFHLHSSSIVKCTGTAVEIRSDLYMNVCVCAHVCHRCGRITGV